jgi:hypothetical protein
MGEHGAASRADHGAAPEERFEDLVGELLGLPGVTPPRSGGGFGRSALRVDNKIFAMLVRGHLVLKLPRRRVDALVAAGEGIRFDANKGTPMKEWLSLDVASPLPWHSLAREALEFVRGAVLAGGRLIARAARLIARAIPWAVG